MSYRPGDIFYKQITTFNVSGVSTNTDSTPWGQLVKNGFDDFSAAAKVFTTNIDVGRYTVSGTIPSTYTYGNSVNIVISGQVAGNLSKAILDLGVLDSYVSTLTTISVTGTLPPVTVSAINPGLTVSVTGVVPIVNLVNTTTNLTNPVISTSVTNPVSVSFINPGTTVSVTGTTQSNVISINPGLTIGVTGTIPLVNLVNTVTNLTNPINLTSSGVDGIQIEPGVNLRQSFTIVSAAMGGVSSGVNNTVWFQGIDNPNQNRISATAISGTRTFVNYVLP